MAKFIAQSYGSMQPHKAATVKAAAAPADNNMVSLFYIVIFYYFFGEHVECVFCADMKKIFATIGYLCATIGFVFVFIVCECV